MICVLLIKCEKRSLLISMYHCSRKSHNVRNLLSLITLNNSCFIKWVRCHFHSHLLQHIANTEFNYRRVNLFSKRQPIPKLSRKTKPEERFTKSEGIQKQDIKMVPCNSGLFLCVRTHTPICLSIRQSWHSLQLPVLSFYF